MIRDKIISSPFARQSRSDQTNNQSQTIVKILDKNEKCFKYICSEFSNWTSEKLKTGIFEGSQVRKLLKDRNFVKIIIINKKKHLFCNICRSSTKFPQETQKWKIYRRCYQFEASFRDIDSNMSIKMPFLFIHLNRFPENLWRWGISSRRKLSIKGIEMLRW